MPTWVLALLVVLGLLLCGLLFLYVAARVRLAELAVALREARRQYEQRLEAERKVLEERYRGLVEEWKRVAEREIRQDAVDKSRAVTVGKVTEHLTPYLPGFPYNPKDVRFVGSPVDLVVFEGLDEGDLRRVVFVEVKSGRGELTRRERMIRDAIRRQAVAWEELSFR